MSIVVQSFKTVSCNGPCGKTVTVENTEQALQLAALEVPWFKTLRIVQTSQGRNLTYCSDECEIHNVATGAHNPEERKSIILPEGANAQQVAAAQAAQAEATTKDLKAGRGLTVVR